MTPSPGPDDVDFEISDDEAAALTDAALAFAAALPPAGAQPYRALAAAAADGAVPVDQLADLERVCALALETGKARSIGGAEAERLLTGMYRRTPGGQAMQTEVADLNRALAQLAGRELRAVRLSWKMPGRYGLSLSVDGFDLTLSIEPDGLSVQTLQTG